MTSSLSLTVNFGHAALACVAALSAALLFMALAVFPAVAFPMCTRRKRFTHCKVTQKNGESVSTKYILTLRFNILLKTQCTSISNLVNFKNTAVSTWPYTKEEQYYVLFRLFNFYSSWCHSAYFLPKTRRSLGLIMCSLFFENPRVYAYV